MGDIVLFIMLSAVDLDHHVRIKANEIYNKRSNRLLPAELMSGELPRPNRAPQSALGVSGVFS